MKRDDMNIPIGNLDPDRAERHPAFDPAQHADAVAVDELERLTPS